MVERGSPVEMFHLLLVAARGLEGAADWSESRRDVVPRPQRLKSFYHS
jgi:hypothetical protein